jgi:hypothetical protein
MADLRIGAPGRRAGLPIQKREVGNYVESLTPRIAVDAVQSERDCTVRQSHRFVATPYVRVFPSRSCFEITGGFELT